MFDSLMSIKECVYVYVYVYVFERKIHLHRFSDRNMREFDRLLANVLDECSLDPQAKHPNKINDQSVLSLFSKTRSFEDSKQYFQVRKINTLKIFTEYSKN